MPKAAAPARKRATVPPPPAPTNTPSLVDELDGATSTDDWFVDLDDTVDFINAVYYGREGSAKTTDSAFMANIPGATRVLIINAEGGVKKSALKKRGVNTDKIVVWPNPKNPEPITHKTLDRIYHRVKADLARDPESWTGVVIDSSTDVLTAILDTVQAKRVNAVKMKGADVDEDFVDISDYGTMSKMFRDLIRKFRDLPCHVVITALERRDVDKDTGKPQYGPAVTPGVQTDLLGYVDFVLMCKAEDEDGPFRALTRANSRYRAKDRFDVLPRVMAEPTFDRLVGYLTGELEEGTDPVQAKISDKTAHAQDAPADQETEDDDDESKSDDS